MTEEDGSESGSTKPPRADGSAAGRFEDVERSRGRITKGVHYDTTIRVIFTRKFPG
jgi:hypothetical protein